MLEGEPPMMYMPVGEVREGGTPYRVSTGPGMGMPWGEGNIIPPPPPPPALPNPGP